MIYVISYYFVFDITTSIGQSPNERTLQMKGVLYRTASWMRLTRPGDSKHDLREVAMKRCNFHNVWLTKEPVSTPILAATSRRS